MNKKIQINLGDKNLTALLTIDSKGGGFPLESDVISALNDEGVIFGIDMNKIKEICQDKKNIENVIIAKGIMPKPGQNGQLVWHLEQEVNGDKVFFNEDGIADYKQARNFCEVKENEEIVSKLPKTKGIDGKAVTGEIVPSGETDIQLPIGEDTRLSDDGLTLYSTKSGFLDYHDGKITISNVYKIDGDVSFNTGNIKYDGQVFISGDVRSGFRVEATDTVVVEGDVEASEIHSKKGDVIIKMGILGKGRAKIVAGRNVECGFIQDAEIKANNNVSAEHYIINGDVYAGGKVFVNENEGLIRGGKVFAEKGIEVNEAGSIKNIKTQLGIGLNRNPEQESKLSKLIKEEDELFNQYELLSKKERFLKLLLERIGKLSEEKQKELTTITEQLSNIKNKLDIIDSDRKSLSNANDDLENKNKIIVTDKLHKGVVVTAGGTEFFIDKLFESVIVYQDLDNIIIDDFLNKQE